MIKILELFGGIGACSKALENLHINYKLSDYVEIDKYAVASFNALHDTNYIPQDITMWDKDIDVDLIMHGSPCQDFSLAGKQAGGDRNSGTRSSLMYETIRIVKKVKPKYVIWENVKNILSKKHIHNFNAYIQALEDLGYTSYYKVLNAKDYGIPQNRERVFTVSIRNDIGKDSFSFPKPQILKKKLKDMLEKNVDEKYYLTEEKIDRISHWKSYQKPFEKVQGNNSIVPTLTARGAGEEHSGMITYSDKLEETTNLQNECLHIKNATKKGYLEATDGDGVYITNMDKKRGTVQKEMIPTLKTSPDIGVVEKSLKKQLCEKLIDENKVKEMDVIRHSYSTSRMNNFYTQNSENNDLSPTLDTRCDCLGVTTKHQNQLRIRKLTPKECWRLMGFDDSDYEKSSKVNSNAQLYKQAGNSIVVNVLQAILENLLKEENNDRKS
jgi:DNA (cytosine-5)-methyltransferase 1